MNIRQLLKLEDKTEYKLSNRRAGKKKTVQMVLLMVFIMGFCTAISAIVFHIKMFESNIVMIYLLGILLYSYLAEGYVFSLSSSVIAVLLYNFFFTEPYFTLKVHNPAYIITFFVMLAVGFITNMLTNRIKLERKQVEDRERFISSLFNIEKKLLDVKSEEELAETSSNEIAEQLGVEVLVQIYAPDGELLCRFVKGSECFDEEIDRAACLETYQSGSPCGHGTALFSDAKAFYTPIKSQNGVLGVVGIAIPENTGLTNTQNTFIDVILPQIAVVLDRQNIIRKEQKVQIEMQKERLRADMLRSISHDFRTPLAGIMGLASTAKDNYDKISDEVRKNFLQSIYEDADWLNELVENILQTSRFEAGRVKLNIGDEAAEEIISDAITHVKKHAPGYGIHAVIPEEIIIIRVDGILIRQVIVNLLNNAINHTPEGTEITVTLYRQENKVIFEVKDNGPGIMPEDLEKLFGRYHRSSSGNLVNRKGMGLGLALCKSIIEAHGGEISINNCEPHGTIAAFYILSGEES